MEKHIGLKERLYASLAEAVYEEVSTESKPSFIDKLDGEFDPFVDNDKWCEYRISCNVAEEQEGDCYDGYICYYQVHITQLEVNAAIWSDKENNTKYVPLNVDIAKLNNMVNDMLYDKSLDIVEDDGPLGHTWQYNMEQLITGGNPDW